MSTTTVFEVPDTPMLDYAPDADFSMEVGHSPQWLSVEATMSDEQILSATDYSEPIEVDMEPTGDEEITEYEMADGEGEFDADGDAELEDVEVIDRSHVGSPLVVSVVHSPQPTHTPLLEHAPAPSNTSLHPPVLFHSSVSPVSPLEQNQLHPATLETTPSHASFLETAAEQGQQTVSEAPGALQDQEDTGTHVQVASHAPDLAATISELSAAPSSDNDPASFEQHVGTHVEDAHVEPAPPSDSTSEGQPAGEASKQEAVAVAVESSTTSEPLLVQGAHEEIDESPTDDPHEISDGVYIDPPPAVLLTLSSSTGLVDCSLFNQPYSGSGSQTPNAYASTSSAPSLALLLSQRPTLYYEPLTHVFNALREEEAISSVAELAEGELVIEAFDLDLKIPEDNVYAREVTLHELNILHDGIDLSGPLRLRLSANPRFVTRYHALREQISQLSIGLEAGHLAHGEYVEQQEASESHDDASAPELEGHTSSENAEALAVSEDTEATTNQSLEPQNEEQLHGEEQPPEEPDAGVVDTQADVEETSGELEAPSAESVPQLDQLEQEEHADTTDQAADSVGLQASEVVTEDGAEVTTGETTEHLDADETHRAADAEEGGDYTDYAEHVEDDDEGFGEDLPEELGGNDDEEGSQQDTLDDEEASDDQESDEHGEDEESGEPTADTESHQAELPSAAADVSNTEDDTAYISSTAKSDNTGDVNNVTNKDATSDADKSNADVDEFDNFEDYEDEDADNLSHYNPDDFEEADASQLESPQDDVAQDTASKYSSETLSSHSKRSRDEDDEDEGGVDGSPGPKRVKTH